VGLRACSRRKARDLRGEERLQTSKSPQEKSSSLKLDGVQKAENASGKTHKFSSTTHQWAHHSHRPRRAAARRSKANTVTPRAQSRREDCSVAAAAATVLLLLLLPLHLSRRVVVHNSATPHAQHRKSAQAGGGLSLVSLHRPPAASPAFHRDTGIMLLDGGPRNLPYPPILSAGLASRGRGEGCSALAK
jgi:hypothetical protein